VAHGAVETPPFLGAGEGFGRGFHGILFFGSLDRNRGVRGRVLGWRLRWLLLSYDGDSEQKESWKNQCGSVHGSLL
jgi:hypothetical protein